MSKKDFKPFCFLLLRNMVTEIEEFVQRGKRRSYFSKSWGKGTITVMNIIWFLIGNGHIISK